MVQHERALKLNEYAGECARFVGNRNLVNQRVKATCQHIGRLDGVAEHVALGVSAEHSGRLTVLEPLAAAPTDNLHIHARRLEKHPLVLFHVGCGVAQELGLGNNGDSRVGYLFADGGVGAFLLVGIGLLVPASHKSHEGQQEQREGS